MSYEKLRKFEPWYVRETLKLSCNLADQIHDLEKKLILQLVEIDQHRLFVRFGYKSLRTYCINALGFSRTQAQRIVTQARRIPTTSHIQQ